MSELQGSEQIDNAPRSVTLRKQSAIFGRQPVGATATYIVRSDDLADVYRRFKREFPDENPMEWSRGGSHES